MIPQYNPYLNQYQQYQSPYWSQYQNSNTQLNGGISGKVVNDASEISVSDIPMDGNSAYFPKRDMSEIYCRSWNNNGTISSVIYKAQKGAETPVLDDTQIKLDDIINRLDKLEKSFRKDSTHEYTTNGNSDVKQQSSDAKQSHASECYANGPRE